MPSPFQPPSRRALPLLLALAAIGFAAAPAAAQQAGGPAEINTRQDRFTIPFSVNDTPDPQRQPVEVQLHVTSDGGITWTQFDRQPPNAGSFSFHAQGDARYGFAIRTIDRLGRAWPEGPLRAELVVRVDTTAPQFDLRVEAGHSGSLQAQWEIRDAELDASTLKLEARASATENWRPLAIQPDQISVTPAAILGNANWWIPAPGSVVDVRGEIRDRAGNLAVVNRRVSLASPPGGAPGGTAPVGNGSGGIAAQPANSRVDPFQRFGGVPGNERPAEQRPATQISRGGDFIPDPTDPVGNPAPQRRDQFTSTGSPSASGAGEAAAPQQQSGPAYEIPPGIEPTMIRTQRFNLQYDINALGPEGVGKVELWVTQNGGVSWRSWGIDPDKQSPLTMEVQQDGLYGVRIVVTSASGFAGQPPQSGEQADFWIGVDSQPPVARITSVPYGDGPNLGKLDIRWSAADVRLAERPITLLFRRKAEEPWVTLAAGLPNTGQYLWSVDPSLVGSLYLKLQVRDAAGNLAEHELEHPVNLAGLAPQGRVRGVLPAE